MGLNVSAEGRVEAEDVRRGRAQARGRPIWLCADDYGISPAVNVAIRDLVVRGRINATSVMVAAPSFNRSEAIALTMLNAGARRAAIGLHVTLTAPFRPLSPSFRPVQNGAFLPLSEMLIRGSLRLLRSHPQLIGFASVHFLYNLAETIPLLIGWKVELKTA